MKFRNLRSSVAAVGLAALLVGCGGGSNETASNPSEQPKPPAPAPAPDPVATAKAALEEAQMAAMGLPATVDTATLLNAWKIVKMKAEELKAVVNAADDGSAADLNAANAALTKAEGYVTTYEAKTEKITAAQNVLKTAMDELDGLDSKATAEQKLAAQEKVKEAATALTAVLQAEGGSTEDMDKAKTAFDTADLAAKGHALEIASEGLKVALAAISDTNPTQEQIDAAKAAYESLERAIAHLPEDQQQGYKLAINTAKTKGLTYLTQPFRRGMVAG